MEPSSEESRPFFTRELPDRPLFGVSNRTDRVINLVVGCSTALLIFVTFLCSFLAKKPIDGLNVFFAICIAFILVSHVTVIYWYRQGDLDPKFRMLIYFNAFSIVLLGICALCFFFREEPPRCV